MKIKSCFLLILFLLLSACNKDENSGNIVQNKAELPKGGTEVKQQGKASWYGEDFNGKKTASGETFNQNQLTAASKTLPLGSKAKVTNVETGKSVTVEINDRGPYVGNRVMDLSKAAAKKIDLKEKGVGHVKIVARKPGLKKTKNKRKY
jgi:rare lipoprotein A